MGNCQKCIEAESTKTEIITTQKSRSQLPLVNMIDSSKNLRTDPNFKNKLKKKKIPRNSESSNKMKKSLKKRKTHNIETDKEYEIIINNKINENLNLNPDRIIKENNKEKNSSDVEITNHNPILTEDQEMDEEEDYEEFLRQKQADELFDSDKNESEKEEELIKNIEHSNDYYNDYNDGEMECIDVNQNYLENVKDKGFEKEMNELNNMNFINAENNNFYHYNYNEDYHNLNNNYNRKIFTNNSCTFIHSKIVEEKEENEEDQESKTGKEHSNKNNAKIANSNPSFKTKPKEKAYEKKNSCKNSENEEAISYEAERPENDVSYEIEGGEIENGNIECKLNIENGKYGNFVGINKNINANGGDDSPKYNTNLCMIKIIEQKINDYINKIKKYPRGKFIVTENFCDYTPEE